MEWSELGIYLLYLLTGVVAGAINTVSGGATVFIFALLIFNGISANVANGTNRFGVLLQNLTGAWTFQRSGLLDLIAALRFGIPAVLGSLLGSYLATDLSDRTMEIIVGVVMTLSLIPMFRQSNVAAFPGSPGDKRRQRLGMLIFFGIGFYGGFVQVGAGLLIISVLTNICGFSIIRGNAVKMAVIFLYTIPAIIVFTLEDHVHWPIAIVLAIGQVVGTRIASKFLIGYSKAEQLAKVLIVLMIAFSLFKTFGGFDWLFP